MARPLPGLDIIRFAAAAMVMMFHLGYWSWVSAGTPAGIIAGRVAYPELSVLSCGWVGVEIFFVLSGFVIAYSAENATTTSFVRGRFLRLAPAAWLCATVTLVFLVLLGKTPSLGAYFHSMAFIPFPPWVDGVYWTLGIEISFYSLILCLLALRAFRRIEWLAWALCVASSIAFVLRPTFNHRIFELLLLEHGAFFALGVFAWLYLLKSHTISNLLGMVYCFPVCLVAIHHVESGKLALPGNVEWLPYVVWVAAMVAMILSVSMPLKPSPLLRRLGLATYPLYLLHDVCGSAIIRWMSDAGADRWVALAVATVVSVALSWCVVFAEGRMRALLRSLTGNHLLVTSTPEIRGP